MEPISTLKSGGSENASYDVIIIGAGISGLAAAAELHSNGISFIILEARDRMGGRIWTDRRLGFPCDLGASWIHQSGPTNPITPLANNFKITRKVTSRVSTERWDKDGIMRKEMKTQEIYDKLHNYLKEEVNVARKEFKTDVPVADVIKKIDKAFYEDIENNFNFAWILESEFGAPLEEVSAFYYDADESLPGEGKAEEVFPTGYDTLVNAMAAPFEKQVLLKKIVAMIDYTDSKNIKITCEDGTVHSSRALIVSVPLGVLKAKSIAFNPALPPKHLDSIKKLGMGVVLNKIFMKFENDFWSEVSQESFFSSTSGATPETRGKFPQFMNGKKTFGANVLLGFSIGKYAKKMEKKTDEEIKNDAMVTLKRMFPKAENPSQFIISRWHSDPFSRGAYSYQAVGSTPEDYHTLKTPICENIYLAGEHTMQKYRATVHGAYMSGKEAAKNLIEYFSKREKDLFS